MLEELYLDISFSAQTLRLHLQPERRLSPALWFPSFFLLLKQPCFRSLSYYILNNLSRGRRIDRNSQRMSPVSSRRPVIIVLTVWPGKICWDMKYIAVPQSRRNSPDVIWRLLLRHAVQGWFATSLPSTNNVSIYSVRLGDIARSNPLNHAIGFGRTWSM